MLLILLLTSVFGLSGCYLGPGLYFGATINYNWGAETHREFIEEIEKFNSLNDGSVDTFISFDLDENKDVSKIYYKMSTIANTAVINKFGLHDKVCDTVGVEIICYLKSNIEDDGHSEYAYKILFGYGGNRKFSNQDKIEIRQETTCPQLRSHDLFYENDTTRLVYKNRYCYRMYANDNGIASIHISSVDEASEEKLNEIIQMLYDSLVIINTEE